MAATTYQEMYETTWQTQYSASSRLRELVFDDVNLNSSSNERRLSESQQVLLYKAKRDKKSVIGLEVIIISKDAIEFLRQINARSLDGVITGFDSASTGTGQFKIDFEGAGPHWLSVEHFKPIKELKLTKENLLRNFFTDLSKAVNKKYYYKLDRIKSYAEEKVTATKRLHSIDAQVVRLKKEVAGSNPVSTQKKSFFEELGTVARRNDIDGVYLSTNGNIMVQTKMLYQTNEKTDKVNLQKKMGKFLFKIDPIALKLKAVNISYFVCGACINFYEGREGSDLEHTHKQGYSHPNLAYDGNICLGENADIVIRMLEKRQMYQLVDFLIIFLSVFPQRRGHPYFPGVHWFKARHHRNKDYPVNKIFKGGILHGFAK